MRTTLCDLLGIEHPIVGFSPSEHVAAAISRAGGLGVLGCVRFNDPADLDAVLRWMDANTGGRPYGVDVVMPASEPPTQRMNALKPRIHPIGSTTGWDVCPDGGSATGIVLPGASTDYGCAAKDAQRK